jgi:hypothetical protein
VTNAISYARSQGVVVVAAAGNYRAKRNPILYPAADPGVIAVAATDAKDKFASFSNAGTYVDIAAPGVDILSTVPNNGYAYYSGTSMASPHVAALAALLLADRPSATPDQVEQAIEAGSVDLGPTGKDKDYGYGRIDAPAALSALEHPGVTITSDAASQQVLYNTPVTTTFSVSAYGTAAAKRAVQLCTADKGAAAKCRTVITSSAGTVSLSRKVTYPYRVRLVVPATKTSFATGESETFSYTVASSVTLAASRTSLVATLAGAVKQGAELQQSANGVEWTTVRSYTAASRTTFTKVPAGLQYRVVVADVAEMAGSTSNTVQM